MLRRWERLSCACRHFRLRNLFTFAYSATNSTQLGGWWYIQIIRLLSIICITSSSIIRSDSKYTHTWNGEAVDVLNN
jgi:hypothetical protein